MWKDALSPVMSVGAEGRGWEVGSGARNLEPNSGPLLAVHMHSKSRTFVLAFSQ